MSKTKVINFCAGPSAGKTTNSLGIAHELKKRRKDVLYIPEFAMQAVVQHRLATLDDQLYIFAKQANKLYDAKNYFEFIVTDAPLFMMLYYIKNSNQKWEGDRNLEYWKLTLKDLIMQTFEMYDNTTFFVDRGDREFRQIGRIQNKEESIAIDSEILQILADQYIQYDRIEKVDHAINIMEDRKII